MSLETNNDREDMFIIWMNGNDTHFEIREFAIVTGLKYGMMSEFISNHESPNRLMSRYFPNEIKVRKNDLISFFKEKSLDNDEDAVKIALFYFISTFLFSTDFYKQAAL